MVYLEAQRLDKAGEMFELSRQHTEAKNALPNNPTFPGWWGRLAERLGDYPAAEARVKKAMAYVEQRAASEMTVLRNVLNA